MSFSEVFIKGIFASNALFRIASTSSATNHEEYSELKVKGKSIIGPH